MSKYKVEKGVPIPPLRKHYPFAAMKVGDSFFAAALNADEYAALRPRLLSAVQYAQRRYKTKYTVRAEASGKGIRVWRTK